MKRILPLIATAAAVLGPAAAAHAKTIELGATQSSATPSCTGIGDDKDCTVLTRITAVQYQIGAVKNPMYIRRSGKLYAFTVALGKPNQYETDLFTRSSAKPVTGPRRRGFNLGPASARITILRPIHRRHNNYHFRVTKQSEDFKLENYFGSTPQFFLSKAIPVHHGDMVALTVPTWAPVLAPNLTSDHTWRASRQKPCANPIGKIPDQLAQLKVGVQTQYFCSYRGGQVTYTVSEGLDPTPTKKPPAKKKK